MEDRVYLRFTLWAIFPPLPIHALKKPDGSVDAFEYLSVIVLVDAVECVADMWAKTIIDHLEIAYRKKDPYLIP